MKNFRNFSHFKLNNSKDLISTVFMVTDLPNNHPNYGLILKLSIEEGDLNITPFKDTEESSENFIQDLYEEIVFKEFEHLDDNLGTLVSFSDYKLHLEDEFDFNGNLDPRLKPRTKRIIDIVVEGLGSAIDYLLDDSDEDFNSLIENMFYSDEEDSDNISEENQVVVEDDENDMESETSTSTQSIDEKYAETKGMFGEKSSELHDMTEEELRMLEEFENGASKYGKFVAEQHKAIFDKYNESKMRKLFNQKDELLDKIKKLNVQMASIQKDISRFESEYVKVEEKIEQTITPKSKNGFIFSLINVTDNYLQDSNGDKQVMEENEFNGTDNPLPSSKYNIDTNTVFRGANIFVIDFAIKHSDRYESINPSELSDEAKQDIYDLFGIKVEDGKMNCIVLDNVNYNKAIDRATKVGFDTSITFTETNRERYTTEKFNSQYVTKSIISNNEANSNTLPDNDGDNDGDDNYNGGDSENGDIDDDGNVHIML